MIIKYTFKCNSSDYTIHNKEFFFFTAFVCIILLVLDEVQLWFLCIKLLLQNNAFQEIPYTIVN